MVRIEPTTEYSKREEILHRAKECVCGQREEDYGTPENNFASIGRFWSEYVYATKGNIVEFKPKDVAMMMALLKVARIASGTGTEDSYVDLAGYAACGAEVSK